jgi:hypothetical protein
MGLKMTTIFHGIELQADPTGHYVKSHGMEKVLRGCVEGCGLLLDFMRGPKDTLAENMVENYQFFGGWTGDTQGEVVDGVFKYPQDPDLYPYMKAQRVEGNKDIIYIYPHAVVCVVGEDGKLVKRTRMD